MAVSIAEAIGRLAPGASCNIHEKKGKPFPKYCRLASEKPLNGNQSPVYEVVCEGFVKGRNSEEIPIAIIKGKDEELGVPFKGLTGEETIFVAAGKRRLEPVLTR